MKELSLNVLDVAKNSVKAGASLVSIILEEKDGWLNLTIADDGCGMTPDMVAAVADPFFTTRTTRKVGMGIPLLTLAAEQTGGAVAITSRHESNHPTDHGTEVVARFNMNHIDATPIGDLPATMQILIMGSPEMDFYLRHTSETLDVELDTRPMREVLGPDVSLASYEVGEWILESLREQYAAGESH